MALPSLQGDYFLSTLFLASFDPTVMVLDQKYHLDVLGDMKRGSSRAEACDHFQGFLHDSA